MALLQTSSLGGMRVGRARPAVARPVALRSALAIRPNPCRLTSVKTQALFGFFQPKPAAPSGPDPRAKELAEDLVKLASGTDYGSKASPQRKEAIAKAVDELSKFCIKNPLKSPLLWGEYEVLYSSKPSAVGGPLRSGAGPTVFPGQNARQILEAPNKLINQVEFKTLGFVPGYSRQFGEITPISPDTFQLSITSGELKAGLGGPEKKTFDIQRKIQIVYLDEELRVARFLPSADLKDDEAAANGGKSEEEIIFVFKRVVAKAAAKKVEEEDDEEEEPARAPKSGTFVFGPKKPLASAATVAERQVRAAIAKEESAKQASAGTRILARPGSAPPAIGSVKVAVGTGRSATPPAAGTSRTAAPPVGTGRSGTPPAGTQRGGRSDLPASVAARTQAGSQRTAPAAPAAPARGTQRGGVPVAPAAASKPGTQARAAPVVSTVSSRRGAAKATEPVVEDPRERRRREQEEARAARAAAEAEAKAAKAKAAEEAAKAKAAEEAKKAKAAEEAKRAAEAKAAKEKAEAEKRAAAEKATAIKSLLAQLADELKARGAEARKAAADAKDAEKSGGAVLKKTGAAKAAVDEAEKEVAEVSEKLGQATAARKDAEKAVKEAAAALAAAEAALKAKLTEALPAASRK